MGSWLSRSVWMSLVNRVIVRNFIDISGLTQTVSLPQH